MHQISHGIKSNTIKFSIQNSTRFCYLAPFRRKYAQIIQMKKLNLLIGILTAFIILSCSSDDNGDQPTANQNGFNFNGTFFSTQYAFVSDENIADDTPSDISIVLSNVNPLQTSVSSGVNYVFFDFEAVELEPGTITEFPDYRILENANLSNFEISGGNTVLDDTQSGFMTTSSSVTINSISNINIDFDFSFTREDGQVISGNYSGTYVDLSN